jgi:hypothetical protein
MEGVTDKTPSITLALGVLGLHYSTTSHIPHEIIDLLKTQVLCFDEHSSLVEENLRALCLMVHVLVARKIWDSQLQSHECTLVKLCEKVSKTNWIRSPRLAAYYLFAFSSFEKFSKITDTAADFLMNRLSQPFDGQQYPFILFGLTLTNKPIKNILNDRIEQWLSQLYKSTESLCILAVVLDKLQPKGVTFPLPYGQLSFCQKQTCSNLETDHQQIVALDPNLGFLSTLAG